MKAYGLSGGPDAGRAINYAPDVVRVATGFVNTYLVGDPGRWILVDTGIRGFAPVIRRAAEEQFGPRARPSAIVLTHGHFDHSGNVNELAVAWDVPVYAHTLELPYLTGRSEYPPSDPTVGGAIACMSRVFPRRAQSVVSELFELEGARVPEIHGWRWIHTPGHTPGHVSLFRDDDNTLLAGDALATMDMDSWSEQALRTPKLCNPPAPLTYDWDASRLSVEKLALLEPLAIAAGHGVPVAGAGVVQAMKIFAEAFMPPGHGRYAAQPAETGPAGVTWVPPAAPDPFPRQIAGTAMVALGALGLVMAARGRHRSSAA
jgi:glyoxylase-like metal-dependent hydrolase (beta-lactamase superfamily II)